MAALGAAREPGPDGDVLALAHNWSVAPAAAAAHGPAGRRPAAGLVPAPGAGAAAARRCR